MKSQAEVTMGLATHSGSGSRRSGIRTAKDTVLCTLAHAYAVTDCTLTLDDDANLGNRLFGSSDDNFKVRVGALSSFTASQQRELFEVLQQNMAPFYGAHSWKTKMARQKKKESKQTDARFAAVFDTQHANDEKLAAFMQFRFVEEEGEPVVYIYELQVQANYQTQGLGKKLVALAEQQGNRANQALTSAPPLTKVMLTVHKSNERARAFYRRLGFDVDDISPAKSDAEGDDAGYYDYEILSKPFS